MAKTAKGKKFVRVKPYKRKPAGGTRKTIKVDGHCRSTPN